MKFLSNWQPLINEDRHTALLFGFMRHAPAASALNPWLSRVLGRSAEAEPLGQHEFWPNLRSVVPGSVSTQPELLLRANDGAPLTVVIEVKPGYGMLQLGQICREVVDTASATGAARIACVMVGADLGPPMHLGAWLDDVTRSLREHLPDQTVEAELRYASFASLGQAARECADRRPEWRAYADDVVAQLRQKGLLGYDGAPMLEDLDGLTIPNVVEGFNRSILAARDFFLQLHGQPRFADLGLSPYQAAHKMLRDGGSEVPSQPVKWFKTTVAMCLYKRHGWAPTRVVFACFDLLGRDSSHADLCVGASDVTGSHTYGFAKAEPDQDLAHPVLSGAAPELPETKAGPDGQWRFDRRPWTPGHADEDIDWALSRLASAARVWDEDLAGTARVGR